MWNVSACILSIKAIAAKKVVRQYSASLVASKPLELSRPALPIQNRRMYWREEWIRGGLVRMSKKMIVGSRSSAEAALASATGPCCMQWMDLTRQSSLLVGVLSMLIFASSSMVGLKERSTLGCLGEIRQALQIEMLLCYPRGMLSEFCVEIIIPLSIPLMSSKDPKR